MSLKIKSLADLNKRVAVSSIALIIVACLIIFSQNVVVGTLLVLVVAVLAAIGIWEYARLAKAKDLRPSSILMIVVAVAVMLSFYLSIKVFPWPLLPLVVLGIGAVSFFLIHFRNPEDALLHVAVEFFGVCYVSVPLCFLLGILYISPSSSFLIPQDGRWWLIYLILATKMTDIGAYFVGRLWGKHKLAPVLSPKKTVEGAVAGFFCAILISLVMHFFGEKFSHGTFELTFLNAVILGTLIGVIGQIGDLSESLLKRDAVVKDSNRLPGLGGILDMLDSLLLTSPIIYFFLRLH